MEKCISLFLTLLMLLFATAACAESGDSPDVTDTVALTDSTSPEETEDPNVDADGYLLDTLPDNLNFDATVAIMYWSDVEHPEFTVDSLIGEIVNDAIYNRNLTVENRLGVTLNWIGTLGNYNNQKNFITQAQSSINSGGEYDIFAGYSMTGATLAVKGYVQDLTALQYLDFDMPWWPETLISKALINDKLYFASGDISTNMLHMMYAVFFNKQMITAYNLDDPYALVDNGQWTYGKMFEMSTGVYADLNGNNARDQGDRYGFSTHSIHFDAFFTGAGLNTVERDTSGELIISPTFNSERTITLLEDICNFMWSGSDAFYGETGTVFALENTMFTLDRSRMALRHKDEITFEYGIVPVPKFDEIQENYVTCLAFPYTMYTISISSKIPDIAAATLECLCSEGYRKTTPMLFEITMKYKYATDNDSARMYDIIRGTVSIDIGRIFTTELNNISYSLFRNSCDKNTASSWANAYRSNSRVLEAALQRINKSMAEISG